MSVNAINAADAPQQKKSNAGSAIGAGVGLGAVGAGAGYYLGGTRPNLEKIFEMKPDEFVTATKEAEGDAKTAADKIKSELEALDGDTYKPDSTKTAEFENRVSGHDLGADHEAVKAEATAQEAFDTEVLKKANEGKAEADQYKKLADVPEAERNTAKEALKGSEAAKNLKEAQTKVKAAKEAAVREAAGAEGADQALKDAVKHYDEAVEAAKTKRANQVAELVKKEEMTSAFDKIKKLFPKEGKGKAALIYGGIAAAVGLLAGAMLGGKKEA